MLDDSDKHWIIDNVMAPLLHEIGARSGEVRDELTPRLDSIDARLKLQAGSGFIQSGARALARFSEFAEDSEERWVKLDKRLRAVEKRLKIAPPNGEEAA